ncbi:hypothetical protein EGI16_21480 [Chryseobacterium sp. G0240]|uniref:hypothetical protein n=1 Tax=Chryseobacterium sp. G0240 TaxID=2487066 RepID=UPI000F45BC9C|nr:hypothetical protein [Chryseobacterium sp. G0240]ROH98409.1 hypothetical protein EGI16_21480 [Chryseobacterium sp. G0240]
MKKTTIPITELTQNPDALQNQIEAWKVEHGEIFGFKLGKNKQYQCYLKKPSRQTISYAAAAAQTDPLQYNEVILNECWLAGDEVIKTDTGLFLSISQHLPGLVEMVEVEMVKL